MNKTMLIKSWIAALVVLGWAVGAQAGPVDFKDVSGDAKWLAHVDVNAAKASPVIQKLAVECGKQLPCAGRHAMAICEKLGTETCAQMHGITLYGEKLIPHQGVAILRAKWDAKRLGEMVEKAPGHKCLDYNGHAIDTWIMHKCDGQGGCHRHGHGDDHCDGHGHCPMHGHHGPSHGHGHEVAGTLYKPDTVVVASCLETLKAALDVLDGKKPSLNGKDVPLAAKPAAGAIFLARAVDLKDSPAAAHCPLLPLVKRFDYAEGQHDKDWFGKIAVTTTSAGVAEDVKKIADGFLAMASLHMRDNADLVGMMHAIQTKVDGDTVSVSFQAPADKLAAQAPALAKLIAEHVHKHMAMMHKHEAMMHHHHHHHHPFGKHGWWHHHRHHHHPCFHGRCGGGPEHRDGEHHHHPCFHGHDGACPGHDGACPRHDGGCPGHDGGVCPEHREGEHHESFHHHPPFHEFHHDHEKELKKD